MDTKIMRTASLRANSFGVSNFNHRQTPPFTPDKRPGDFQTAYIFRHRSEMKWLILYICLQLDLIVWATAS
jgi:hypothetical protein